MDIPKQDIRITKTHKALVDTVMALLEKKPFQKITVSDICQNSMVSRATFYLHFEDKYQLLSYCLQLEQERLLDSVQEQEPRDFIYSILARVQEKYKVYRNLFLSDINQELFKMFHNYFSGFLGKMLEECEKQGVQLAGPIPIISVYYSNGLSGLTFWWIESDFRYSTDEIAVCLCNLLSDILPD